MKFKTQLIELFKKEFKVGDQIKYKLTSDCFVKLTITAIGDYRFLGRYENDEKEGTWEFHEHDWELVK
jgi:hypothetical protein